MCRPLLPFCSGYVAPWSGRFYSLWDTGYAKIHIPIIASVSEHQPTTWVSFFFDLHILVCVFPAGAWFVIKEINDERVFSESALLFPNCFVFWVIAAWKSGNVYASAANSRHWDSLCRSVVQLSSRLSIWCLLINTCLRWCDIIICTSVLFLIITNGILLGRQRRLVLALFCYLIEEVYRSELSTLTLGTTTVRSLPVTMLWT